MSFKLMSAFFLSFNRQHGTVFRPEILKTPEKPVSDLLKILLLFLKILSNRKVSATVHYFCVFAEGENWLK